MSAAWAQSDKCPLWNAEMNSQKEKKGLSSLLQRPQTRGFSHSKLQDGNRGRVLGKHGGRAARAGNTDTGL